MMASWFTQPRSLRSRSTRALSPIYTTGEFRDLLARECDRAKRYDQRLSLAVFDVNTSKENSLLVRRLVRTLHRRFRNIDEMGWYTPSQIGVILPVTPERGAWKLAEDICTLMSDHTVPPPFTIYTYPSLNWPSSLLAKPHGVFGAISSLIQSLKQNSIYNGEDFREVLEIERERADRSRNIFSLILFDIRRVQAVGIPVRDFVRKLNVRLRDTDEIGWFDEYRIGAVLPYSAQTDACSIAERFLVSLAITSPGSYVTYTYPDNWILANQPQESVIAPSQSPAAVLSVTESPTPTGNIPAATGQSEPPLSQDDRDSTDDDRTYPEYEPADQPSYPPGPSCAGAGTPEQFPIDPMSLFISPIPAWKRGFDFSVALVAIVLLSPILVATALLIRIFSPGPILFGQQRAGLGGRPFTFYKFRTMVVDAERLKKDLLKYNERSGPVFKMTDDPRVTPIGSILRRWSIDELPQFFNVLFGDMSIVGPRPLPVAEDRGFDQWHMVRRYIRPGITCLWQISARDQSSFDDWVRLDIEYARKQSFLLDMKILLLTIPAVISKKGAV